MGDPAGITRLYLQVEAANDPARLMYGALGFTHCYGYHYRVGPGRTRARAAEPGARSGGAAPEQQNGGRGRAGHIAAAVQASRLTPDQWMSSYTGLVGRLTRPPAVSRADRVHRGRGLRSRRRPGRRVRLRPGPHPGRHRGPHRHETGRFTRAGRGLLDEIVTAKPHVDHTMDHSPEELRDAGLGHLGDAVALLQSKVTPAEVDDYRRFVLALAGKVAAAHREHGQSVSPG